MNCILRDNKANRGAGFWSTSYDAQITISNCTFAGNEATVMGGAGIFIRSSASVEIQKCRIVDNAATGASGSGGGVYISNVDSLSIQDCVISSNSANRGGGLYLDSGAASCVYNCTLSGNVAAGSGGGAYGAPLYNCVLYYNSSPNGADVYGGEAFNSCASDLTHGVNGNINNTPLFVDAVNGDFRLQPNSPCINWGDSTKAATATDLDGNPRIVDSFVDMGAYEYQIPISASPSDRDNDRIDDDWEILHFGGNGTPGFICSNGVNTLLEAYIAGLDPNDPDAAFLTSIHRVPTEAVLVWNAISGRVYSVYWSTNLLSGFQSLETNIPWTRASFTNHSVFPCGYYRINVQMED